MKNKYIYRHVISNECKYFSARAKRNNNLLSDMMTTILIWIFKMIVIVTVTVTWIKCIHSQNAHSSLTSSQVSHHSHFISSSPSLLILILLIIVHLLSAHLLLPFHLLIQFSSSHITLTQSDVHKRWRSPTQ